MLSTRMRIAKDLIARGIKKGDHAYVTEYYDRIAAAKEEAKNKPKMYPENNRITRGLNTNKVKN